MNIKPPGFKDRWEDLSLEAKCLLLGYAQIREMEEEKSGSGLIQAMMGAAVAG